MSLTKKIVSISLILLLCGICGGIYYLFFTSEGSQFLTRRVLGYYTLERSIQFDSVEGDLVRGITFNNLFIRDLKELPENTELRIQSLSVQIKSLERKGVAAAIVNARLQVPFADSVVMSCKLEKAQLTGSLLKQSVDSVVLDNLLLRDIKELPKDSELRVQSLSAEIYSLPQRDISAEIVNTRLRLPISEPFIMNATMDRGELTATLFNRSLDVSEIVGYLPKNPHTRHLEGLVSELDLEFSGDLLSPVVSGSLFIDKMDNRDFELHKSPVQLKLQYRQKLVTPELVGDIAFASGEIMSKRTIIKLQPSKLLFSGTPKNPRLDINGSSRISKVDITIGIKGELQDPQILLSSNPVLPKELLLLMVATGKKWSGVTESLATGEISTGVAKDFIQYFFLGGRGNFIADKFGLSDFSVSVSPDRQGVGAAKQITEQVEVKYEIERQSAGTASPTSTTQKVGGAISVTNRVSLDVNKEFNGSNGTSDEDPNAGAAEIMLKFKTSF